MAAATLPAIDANTCAQWTQDDISTYQKLPYYFAKGTAAYQQKRQTWEKLLKELRWEGDAKATDTLRLVGIERTPVLRQFAFPTDLASTPTADIAYLRERITEAKVKRHRFTTPNFQFLADFNTFLGNKIVPYREDLNRQIQNYAEAFYRGYMWNHSPKIYVAGLGMIDAPTGDGNTAMTSGKTAAWLAAEVFPKVKSHLTFEELYQCLHQAEDEVGVTPFSGSEINNAWSEPLSSKFALVGDNEIWTQFINDPWVKENRSINLNIVTAGLKGDIFGRIMFRAEYNGPRFKVDNDNVPTLPTPETTIVDSPEESEKNRTAPHVDYSKNAQFGVAWFVGGPSYQIIKIGPPPSEFTGKDVNGIMGMDWNGKVYMTRNFLTQCLDADGNTQLDTNSWGEYIRMQAQIACGIVGYNKFNVVPIVYKRKNRLDTTT